MKLTQTYFYKHLSVYLFVLIVISSCERIEKDVELPLPEVYLTSTRTDISQTKVLVKGERLYVRKNGTDIFGVVYADKPEPTISDPKLSVSENNGIFEVTAPNLKANTTYYFRAYLQTKDKVYYSNQLESNGVFDNRWERLDDFPPELIYSTGVLFFQELLGNGFITFESAEKAKNDVTLYYYIYDLFNSGVPKKKWFPSQSNIDLGFSGLRNLYLLNPNKDRIFIGGGYLINNNLPSPKVYNQNLWKDGSAAKLFNLPCPIEGETVGMTIGRRMFVLSTQSNSEVYEFTNLQWDKMKDNTFANLGRIISTGTSSKGYVISESYSPQQDGGKLYEFDPNTELWVMKQIFMGEERNEGIVFSVKEKLYYGFGRSKKSKRILQDIWEYDPQKNSWQQIAYYPGNGNMALVKIEVEKEVYLGMGYQSFVNEINGLEFSGVRDFWSFKL